MLHNLLKPLWVRLCIGCVLTLALCLGWQTQPALAQSSAADLEQFADLPRLEGIAQVEMKVNGSTIEIELRGDKAPITAGNFTDLVKKGFYDGISFHRVVRDPQPFVVQGGDPQSLIPDFPAGRLGTGGYIDPDTGKERNIPLEIMRDGDETLVYNRTLRRGVPVLTHQRGAIAMARAQAPNSASSQFYITLSDLPFLDGNYAVFGYVTQGMDAVDQIQQGDRIESIKLLSD